MDITIKMQHLTYFMVQNMKKVFCSNSFRKYVKKDKSVKQQVR